jgi:hypothetical protein
MFYPPRCLSSWLFAVDPRPFLPLPVVFPVLRPRLHLPEQHQHHGSQHQRVKCIRQDFYGLWHYLAARRAHRPQISRRDGHGRGV